MYSLKFGWLLASSLFEIVAIFGAVYLGITIATHADTPLTLAEWFVILLVVSSVIVKAFIEFIYLK